jgi:hypothetical protein
MLGSGSAWDVLVAVYAHPIVRAVLGLLAANIIAGLAAAFKSGDFHLAVLGDWLLTRAIPYLLGAGAVQVVLLTVPPEWGGITQVAATGVWLFVVASLLGHILDALRDLGLPIPAMLGDKPKAEVTSGT